MVERSKRIELRVTADELRQIHERMQEAGISSLTAYMIRMALHGYVIVMDLSDLKEVLRLLQISGNNLNQYAKKANETGSIYKEDIDDIRLHQEELWKVMKEILKQNIIYLSSHLTSKLSLFLLHLNQYLKNRILTSHLIQW